MLVTGRSELLPLIRISRAKLELSRSTKADRVEIPLYGACSSVRRFCYDASMS